MRRYVPRVERSGPEGSITNPRLLLPHEKLFEAPPAPREQAQTTVANIVAELEAQKAVRTR